MAGLPWIKVDLAAPSHPKVQRLEKHLNVADAFGLVVRLWTWTATYCPDGEIPESALDSAVRAAVGPLIQIGDPGVTDVTLDGRYVTEALVSVGLMEPHDGRYVVHGWDEHQAAHADKAQREKEQNAERQRRFRNRRRLSQVTEPSRVTPTVTVTENNGGEERRGEEKKQTAPRKREASAPPSDFAAARDRLVATYASVLGGKYLWNGAKDAEGLKRILALGVPLDTIDSKWRTGLRGKGWGSARTVAQLAAKWNDLEVNREVDELERLRDAAERDLAGSGPGRASVAREAPAREAAQGALAAVGVALQAAGGIVLGARGTAGEFQDGASVEPRPERR